MLVVVCGLVVVVFVCGLSFVCFVGLLVWFGVFIVVGDLMDLFLLWVCGLMLCILITLLGVVGLFDCWCVLWWLGG